MAARAAELGDVGESDPSNWEKPLGHQRRPRRRRRALARRRAAGGRPGEGPPRLRGVSRRRADLASGLLPAPDRPHLLRLQGRHRPAGGRRKRQARRPIRRRSRSRPARSSSAIPTRRASCRPCPPGGAGPQRHLRGLPQAAHAGGGLPAVPARQGREPRGGGVPRRQDGRPLAERSPAGGVARSGTTPSSARIRSATTTSATPTICAASSARPVRTPGGPTPGTRSTRTAASTCACTA